MSKVTGKHWSFLMVNSEHQLKVLCPPLIKLEEVYFDISVDGLRKNFYDNSLFKTKNEAIDAMIAQLEKLKND